MLFTSEKHKWHSLQVKTAWAALSHPYSPSLTRASCPVVSFQHCRITPREISNKHLNLNPWVAFKILFFFFFFNSQHIFRVGLLKTLQRTLTTQHFQFCTCGNNCIQPSCILLLSTDFKFYSGSRNTDSQQFEESYRKDGANNFRRSS